MFDATLRPVVDRCCSGAGRWLANRGVSASVVSIIGFGFGVLAAFAIVNGLMMLAFCLIMLNRICDGLDGAVARATHPTDFGGFLDITLDFVFYAMIPFAFAIHDPANAVAACFLIFSFFGTGVTFLGFAVMAERRGLQTEVRGKKSFYYLGGLTEGAETIIILLLMTLTPDWFVYYAYLFGALCWITASFRTYEAYQKLPN